MCFENTGRFLATGAVIGGIKVFDVKKGTQTHEFKNHNGSITSLIFHPNP